MRTNELFSSRWGLLLAALGMAVGTGNIWRFPRIAAQNGGGAFLIPWLIFLLLWAIPLLMIESAMGRQARLGPVGAFGKLMGRRFVWMGCFVGFCTMAIMFYYSVVAGWCVKYLIGSISGELMTVEGSVYWRALQSSGWEPVLYHLVAMGTAGVIVYRGVVAGIERASKVLIPMLFILLIAGAVRALTLPGAAAGLDYLFNPDFSRLREYQVWLQALTQSAWSTGAGWGLLLTYSIYTRSRQDIVLNSFTIGFGNNSASLLAALVVFPTVFAVLPGDQARTVLASSGPASTGLSFVWVPQLFAQLPAGQLFMSLFFLALVVAAISSLISMVEMATRIFMDAGLERRAAVRFVVGVGFLLGIPSALSLTFLGNQDNVWGIGLMVSGFFFAMAVRTFGTGRFRKELIESANNDIAPGKWFDVLVKYVIPVEFAVMLGWWLYQSATGSEAWWNPFGVFTLGACLAQWGLALLLFYLANEAIARRTLGAEEKKA